MERNNHSAREIVGGWEAWEASPRDGPAVFVIDTAALDGERRLRGRWLDLRRDPSVIRDQLAELLGRDAPAGAFAVIDQVGLGPRMAPETVSPDELPWLADQLAPEERL